MATSYYAPDPCQSTFLLPGSNTPGAGVQVFFYSAGTSTKQTAYQDQAGGVAHTNPMVLDAGGNVPGTGSVWFAAMAVYDVVYAPSNDTDPPASPYRTVQDISGVNDVATQTGVQWVTGPTPTFVGVTRFTLAGDQTANAQVGRRIQTNNTGGTIYSYITSSVFSSTTAVGVKNDSGVLDSGLSALSYGLLTPLNPSIPVLSDNYASRYASSDATKWYQVNVNPIPSSTTVVETLPIYSFRPATQNRGAQVSSNSTTNVSTATGDLIEITNTNAISQFTMFEGQVASLLFQANTPLVNSAVLPLPGGLNTTTSPGDVLTLRGTSTNAVIVQSANQLPGMTLLSATTAVNASAVIFSNLDARYSEYEFHVINAIPQTTNQDLWLRVSTSNGASFYTGNAYRWGFFEFCIANSSSLIVASVGDSKMALNHFGSASFSESGTTIVVKAYTLGNQSRQKSFSWTGANAQTSDIALITGAGKTTSTDLNTSVVNAIEFMYSAGSISTGIFKIYGIR